MDMSAAALPARYGHASEQDRKHPRFAEYQQHRSAMSKLMVDSLDFKDWLSCTMANEARDAEANHPRFAEWQRWFVAGKRGRERTLPDGSPNSFPNNFRHWLTDQAFARG